MKAITPKQRAEMRWMRMEGFTIEQIKKRFGVTWRTAWKHSRIKGGVR